MLEEILVKEGYHVSRAYSGTEALLFLSATRPDLVLLDLMLPGLNGEIRALSGQSGVSSPMRSSNTDFVMTRPGFCISSFRMANSVGVSRILAGIGWDAAELKIGGHFYGLYSESRRPVQKL